ncbi:MAG: DNA-binding domain-containing protein [Pseudomonadota bacterium]
MTRKLADVQAGFVEALTQPELAVPETIAWRRGRPVPGRFNVYRNNVVAGMTEALRATFPAVEKLVGEDFFGASARIYIDRNPPQSPLLFRYGEAFGDFLDGFPPAASTPYLGDVARLEWARLKAYHAEDCAPLSIQDLGNCLDEHSDESVAPGDLRFALHPSLSLIRSRWPVVSLWAASTNRGTSDDVNMKVSEAALIVRPALLVETRQLPEPSFAFISALMHGQSLEMAAGSAIDTGADFDLTIQLQALFALGAVVAINDNSS